MSHEEFVLKRNGEKQPVSFDKILYRIKALSNDDLKRSKEVSLLSPIHRS